LYIVSKILHQQTLQNIHCRHRFDIEGCNPANKVVFAVVVPVAYGREVISSLLWHPSRV